MKKHLIFPLTFVVLGVIACGGDGARRGDQKASYETVQEGSAAGVTSTIQGPGEQLPPITGTNADTTTAFSINPNAVAVTTAAPPPNTGTLAGTYPLPPSGMTQSAPYPRTAIPPMTSAAPAQPQPRATPPPQRTVPQPAPQPQEPVEPPPATDTAMTSTTATTSTTSTQPPPTTQTNPPQKQEEEEEEEEPPPPTTTDTRGGM